VKKPNPELKVSDWVTFLTGEKQGLAGSLVGFTAIVISALAVFYSVFTREEGMLFPEVFGAIIYAVMMVAAVVGYTMLNRSHNKAKDILKRVMDGELTSGDEIYEAWNSAGMPDKSGSTESYGLRSMRLALSWGKSLGIGMLSPLGLFVGILVGFCETARFIWRQMSPLIECMKRPWPNSRKQ
jgi:hypothetical protein